jgi:membrane protein insertase Oxa1/YidC/SpoIIIJ
MNLLGNPKSSKFKDMLWVFPVLSFVTAVASSYIMKKSSAQETENNTGSWLAMLLFPAFQAWIIYTVFAAVGLYLVVSGILGIFQNLITDKFFSVYIANAKLEFKRFEKMAELENKEQLLQKKS